MRAKWLRGIIIGALALAGTTAWGQIRDVTFSVDMAVQIDLNNFDPDTMGVDVRGGFNEWGTTALAREGATTVYSTTVAIEGDEGDPEEYKFFNNGPETWEADPNRSFNLGPAGTPQVLDTVYFDNQGPVGPEVTADVTFSVNMAVQIDLGNFDQGSGEVQIRGPFNEWGVLGTALTQEGETTVYSTTISVTAPEGSDVPHKFYIVGFPDPDDGYESGDDRTFVMGEDGVPRVLDTVWFNNEEPASGLSLDGTWNPATMGDYEFTVTRNDPGIGDVINLNSDNELAATVPPNVTFGDGEDEATFMVTVVSLDSGDVTITAVDPISGDMAEYDIRMPRIEIDGPWQVYAAGPDTYTLTRFNNISDTVNLTSSDPAVMTVPLTASFVGDADETTFQATALLAGTTTLTATDPVNGVFDEFNVTFSAPRVELSGPVTVWEGTTPTYTVTRFGPAGDTVYFSSSEPGVMTVPAQADFPWESDVLSIEAAAVGLGITTLSAWTDTVPADILEVEVVEGLDLIAYDDASLYADGVWTLTPAHDTGFSDWTEWLNPDPAPDGVHRGSFIGSSAIPGMDEAGASFGLYANYDGAEPDPLPEVKLFRGFPAPMLPGQIFSVDVGYDWSSGTKGFRLWGHWEDTGYERFELFNSGNDTWSYKLDGDDDTITVIWDGYIEGGFMGTVQAVCTAPETFDFGFQRAGGEWVWVEDVVLPGTIDQIELYNYNGGSGDAENFYFNRMWLTAGADPDPDLDLDGPWDITSLGMYEYTLTRVGDVGDDIDLVSGNEAAVTVPASVSFNPGEDTVTFWAEVVSLVDGDATITATDPDSGAWAEFTIRPREVGPGVVELIYDPATRGMSFSVPVGYDVQSIEWASQLVGDAWDWQVLPVGHVTVDNGTVTIPTAQPQHPPKMVIRVYIQPSL